MASPALLLFGKALWSVRSTGAVCRVRSQARVDVPRSLCALSAVSSWCREKKRGLSRWKWHVGVC